MLLHEQTVGDGAAGARLARHYYDLWCLIRAGVAARAAADLELFKRAAAHRKIYFPRKGPAQQLLAPGHLRAVPPLSQQPDWKRDYEAMRDSMFFGESPSFEEILDTIAVFQPDLNETEP